MILMHGGDLSSTGISGAHKLVLQSGLMRTAASAVPRWRVLKF